MWAYDQPDTLYATVHPASISKIGRFLLKPDTQLRVSPCFGSRTRPARPFPNPRIFPVRGNQLHPPRSTKINIPAASAPRTAKLYHFPSPRVNYRARPNWHTVSDTQCQNANSAPAANPVRNPVRFPSPSSDARYHG